MPLGAHGLRDHPPLTSTGLCLVNRAEESLGRALVSPCALHRQRQRHEKAYTVFTCHYTVLRKQHGMYIFTVQ